MAASDCGHSPFQPWGVLSHVRPGAPRHEFLVTIVRLRMSGEMAAIRAKTEPFDPSDDDDDVNHRDDRLRER
jgi:hypothetical protein